MYMVAVGEVKLKYQLRADKQNLILSDTLKESAEPRQTGKRERMKKVRQGA